MSLARFGYTLLLYLLLPRVAVHLLLRARKQPAYLRHLGERFGFYREDARAPVLWIHAVSVGETRAAQPLIESLRRSHPGHRILLTHMTPTGRETGEQLFGDTVTRCYLPYDFPFAVRRFLDHFAPVAGVLMETEIWFNLIDACRQRRIPLYLGNARLSERSHRRYARVARLARISLRGLAAIAAQSEADAERLRSLGAEAPVVTGNVKFDISPPAPLLQLGRRWREDFGAERPVLLAASTREGEETLLLDALDRLEVARALLVIVPRHPQRFDEVAQLLEQRAISFQRRSAATRVAPGVRVLLGDSMGEMFAYYAACDLAFIGGSLLPYGGQNLIEACAAGAPVIVGPYVYNFEEAARLAVDAGAALQVEDAPQAMREATRLLRDTAARRAMAQAGIDFSRRHQGATERLLALLRF